MMTIEDRIMQALSHHMMNREIADACGITKDEVRSHLVRLCAKHGVQRKPDLIGTAISLGYAEEGFPQ